MSWHVSIIMHSYFYALTYTYSVCRYSNTEKTHESVIENQISLQLRNILGGGMLFSLSPTNFYLW